MDSEIVRDALSRLALTANARNNFAQTLKAQLLDKEALDTGILETVNPKSAEFITEAIAIDHRCQHSEWDDLIPIVNLAKTGSRPYVVHLLLNRAFSPLELDVTIKSQLIQACFDAPNGLTLSCVQTLLTGIPARSPLLSLVQAGFKEHVSRPETMRHIVRTLIGASRNIAAPGLFQVMMPVLASAIMESSTLAQCLIDLSLSEAAQPPVFRVLLKLLKQESADFLQRRAQANLKFPTELVCPITWYIVVELYRPPLPGKDRCIWLLKLLSASENHQIVKDLIDLALNTHPDSLPKRLNIHQFLNPPPALSAGS